MFFSKKKECKKESIKGFTLIEALVLLFIFSVVSITFLQTYAVGTHLIIESKNRLGATALANQKMEIIRSLDYSAVGTQSGVPAGDILPNEDISINTTKYTVHTVIQYVDDPFDGRAALGTDTTPNDYKKVHLEVSWGAGGDNQKVILFANISPNGIETPISGGVLTINILDTAGAGIPGVSVHLVNPSTSIDAVYLTDATGNVTLPGTPTSTPLGDQDYALTVSKTGYYTAINYPPAPTSTFDPVDEYVSVVDGVLNPVTMVLTEATNLTIQTKDPSGTALPNIDFTIKGGKILGTTLPAPGTDVYSLDQSANTGGSGSHTFSSQSTGTYTIKTSSARYEFWKLNPSSVTPGVVNIVSGGNQNVDIVLLDTQIGSVKAIIQNQADGTPLAGASVHLTNTLLSYDATEIADQYGVAYFSTNATGLTAGTYTMDTSMTGFADTSESVVVSTSLVTKTTQLTAN